MPALTGKRHLKVLSKASAPFDEMEAFGSSITLKVKVQQTIMYYKPLGGTNQNLWKRIITERLNQLPNTLVY